ncbi:hypothetical protein ACEQ8H_003477 [Pleosporales sp. CAS-2024a]
MPLVQPPIQRARQAAAQRVHAKPSLVSQRMQTPPPVKPPASHDRTSSTHDRPSARFDETRHVPARTQHACHSGTTASSALPCPHQQRQQVIWKPLQHLDDAALSASAEHSMPAV